MKIGICNNYLIYIIFTFFIPLSAIANKPVWLIDPNPLTPTIITVSQQGSATVEYTITNQSSRAHQIQMEPISGVTQVLGPGLCGSPVSLGPKNALNASCNLVLLIDGNKLPPQGVHSTFGHALPKFCQVVPNGPSSMCYGPNSIDLALDLRVTNTSSLLFAGAQNGVVYRSMDNGASWASLPSMPNPGHAVNSIFATPNTIYAGAESGSVFYLDDWTVWRTTTAPASNQIINSVFFTLINNVEPRLYVGSSNGHVYYTRNGSTWTDLGIPDPTQGAVNSLFVVPPNTIYVGTINGYVVYTPNQGQNWITITPQPDGSAVNNVFIANNSLYANTANEYTYTSSNLSGNVTWTTFAQTVFALFVNSNGSVIDAGTQGGYVFSLIDGTELGFVTYSPLNSIFAVSI